MDVDHRKWEIALLPLSSQKKGEGEEGGGVMHCLFCISNEHRAKGMEYQQVKKKGEHGRVYDDDDADDDGGREMNEFVFWDTIR